MDHQRITLTRASDGWTATFHDDAHVYDLFGTYTIPTAFTALAEADVVQAFIQRLNPLATVEVSSDRVNG